MKNIERYDEEVKRDPAAEAACEKRKKRQAIFRRAVMFVGKLLVLHLAMMIIFDILLTNPVAQMIIDSQNSFSGVDPDRYKGSVLAFSLFSIALLGFIASLDLSASGERRREFMGILKNESISFSLMWRDSKNEVLLQACSYLIYQIPICIFYHAAGFYFINPTLFEGFHVMDIGLYEITGIGVVGLLLNVIVFAAVVMIFRILTYLRWSKQE